MLLGNIRIQNCIVLSSLNPFDILNGANDSSGKAGQFGQGKEIFDLLHLDNFFYVLRRDLFLIAACVLAVALLKLLIVNNPREIAEKKRDIAHKLVIVLIGASVIGILNILYHFFTNLF